MGLSHYDYDVSDSSRAVSNRFWLQAMFVSLIDCVYLVASCPLPLILPLCLFSTEGISEKSMDFIRLGPESREPKKFLFVNSFFRVIGLHVNMAWISPLAFPGLFMQQMLGEQQRLVFLLQKY